MPRLDGHSDLLSASGAMITKDRMRFKILYLAMLPTFVISAFAAELTSDACIITRVQVISHSERRGI